MEKTKEEIIKGIIAPLTPTYNLSIADCQQIVFPAMDIWADQEKRKEAIAFAEWMYNDWQQIRQRDGSVRHLKSLISKEYTTAELYDLYQSLKQK